MLELAKRLGADVVINRAKKIRCRMLSNSHGKAWTSLRLATQDTLDLAAELCCMEGKLSSSAITPVRGKSKISASGIGWPLMFSTPTFAT
jgi:hypothetical protein